MHTVTKKELVDRIADRAGANKVLVKKVVQSFLDEAILELARGNRLEFRDFGVFEVVVRRARTGRNPRTGDKVAVPPKRVVTFKMGKVMREKIGGADAQEPKANPQQPTPPPAI